MLPAVGEAWDQQPFCGSPGSRDKLLLPVPGGQREGLETLASRCSALCPWMGFQERERAGSRGHDLVLSQGRLSGGMPSFLGDTWEALYI